MNVFAASLAGRRRAPQDESAALGRSLRYQAVLTLASVLLMAIVGAVLVARQPAAPPPAGPRLETARAALQLQEDVLRVNAALQQWAVAAAANAGPPRALDAGPSGEMRSHLAAIWADGDGDAASVKLLDQQLASWATECQRIAAAVASKDRAALALAIDAAARQSAAVADTSSRIADRALRQADRPAAGAAAASLLPALLLGALGTALALGYLVVYRRWRAGVQRSWEKLAREASRDALTGAHTRRKFLETAQVEFSRAQRHRLPLAALIVDLDHFEQLVDRHGADAGELVLKEFSRAAKAVLRRIDCLGRLGEQRFAILLPHADIRSATLVGRRLCESVARLRVAGDDATIRTTASVGVAELGSGMSEFDELMNEADAALREAQARGRDCVSAAGEQLDFTGHFA